MTKRVVVKKCVVLGDDTKILLGDAYWRVRLSHRTWVVTQHTCGGGLSPDTDQPYVYDAANCFGTEALALRTAIEWNERAVSLMRDAISEQRDRLVELE